MARKIDYNEWRKSQKGKGSGAARDARFERYEPEGPKHVNPLKLNKIELAKKLRVGAMVGMFLGLFFALWADQSLFNGAASGALLGAVWMFFRTVMVSGRK